LKNRTLQKKSTDAAVAVPWVLGAALAFRRKQILDIGGFDESIFLYFEEVDLCYRLAEQKLETHFVPHAEVMHVGAGTTIQKRAWYYNMFFISLAQFYRKHYSRFLLAELVVVVKSVAVFKFVRDLLMVRMNRDETKQPLQQVLVEMDRNLVFGNWHQIHAEEPVVPA
jgi:GT2 family glycosyltransferase